jgi:hypothetical protein
MIFQHTWASVLNGTKTQTRRLVKPGQELTLVGLWPTTGTPRYGVTAGLRMIYAEGQTYAVQPGRGQKSVARVRITNIRREDVRAISETDAKAEGFSSPSQFLRVWCEMHDKPALYPTDEGMLILVDGRPAARYDAWALTFEVVNA